MRFPPNALRGIRLPEGKERSAGHAGAGHRARLRERVLNGGNEALADYELLEFLLFAGMRQGDTKPAAKALIGSRLEAAAVEAAAAACRAACKPIDDKRGTIVYRTKVAGVLLKRAVAIAADRAGRA